MSAIVAPASIAIIGGGQLGRMTAMAARSLGLGVNVLDPERDCAARGVADRCVTAPFEDVDALRDVAEGCAAVTFEIERIPADALAALAEIAPVRPGPHVLEVVQDRITQKQWLVKHGFSVGEFRVAHDEAELARGLGELSARAGGKASRGGYDGRGQIWTTSAKESAATWKSLGARPVVAEKGLSLAAEFSVLVARRPGGQCVVYPPAFNVHRDGILEWSVIPAPLGSEVLEHGADIARGIATTIDVVGLLVVELFVTSDGAVLVNELAPRPHNSYHASENACATSQFEQHVRAVCDLPLGAPTLVKPAAIANLLGDLWLADMPPDVAAALSMDGVRVVLYGKKGARAGRKMGHIVATGDDPHDALSRVREAYRKFAAHGAK